MKYIAGTILIAGCICATSCMHRTVSQSTSYGTSASRQKSGERGRDIVEDETYWIWQAGFWKSGQ